MGKFACLEGANLEALMADATKYGRAYIDLETGVIGYAAELEDKDIVPWPGYQKYTVRITERLCETVDVFAESEDDAEYIVERAYKNGEHVLTADNHVETIFMVAKEGTEGGCYEEA